MNQLAAVRIQRFKAINDAPFDLSALNVLVGANNSGKSSIIQGLHFGVGLLQTVLLSGNWTQGNTISTSINPTQLIYSPSEDVAALAMGGKLLESPESAIKFEFSLASGEKPAVSVRKGRNRNILVAIDQQAAAKRLASLEHPFSVFSPGLAGVTKTEQHVSDGVLLRTIARGDANLVLRNIVLRLWDTPEWTGFLDDLRQIFPGVDFEVRFRSEIDEFIDVKVRVGDTLVPLELVGTGVLQAAQILSYIHRFSPSLVVLDEPDSHLHPNNQRLLCALLRRVAEERETQILLTTHSRHIVDAIGSSVTFLWVRNGTAELVAPDDEIGVLLDIGALDVKERVGQPSTRLVVLTEDENTRPIEAILQSSGCLMHEVVVIPYYGISAIKQLRPLVSMIAKTNPSAKVVLHRDRDYMTDAEVANWEVAVRNLRVEPVVTKGVDIESHFLKPKHLAAVNTGVRESEFSVLVQSCMKSCIEDAIQHYVNGRIDIERANGTYASLNHGRLATEAVDAVNADLVRWSHGKTVLKTVRREYQQKYGKHLIDIVAGDHCGDEELEAIANKVFFRRHKNPA